MGIILAIKISWLVAIEVCGWSVIIFRFVKFLLILKVFS